MIISFYNQYPMGIKDLKKIVESVGGVVIFDGDEPSLIVLPFDKYQAQISGGAKLTGEGRNQNDFVSSFKPTLASNYYTDDQPEFDNSQIFSDQERSGDSDFNQDDKNLVEQLNQEIETLKEEIKMREAEELE